MGYLVTGSKGFIGRNLVSHFEHNNIKYSTELWESADTVIHLSANTNVRESIKNPVINFSKNTLGTFDALFNSRVFAKNFIFASSLSATNPRSPYLASKACGEAYCKAFKASYGINTYIARFSNVYGPCSEYKDSIIAKYIKAAINDKPFTIYGDGKQRRDFIYVEDVVKSVLKLNKPITSICSGETISINELIEIMSTMLVEYKIWPPKITYTDAQSGEITNMTPKEGILNPTPLTLGLRKTIQWFIKYQS